MLGRGGLRAHGTRGAPGAPGDRRHRRGPPCRDPGGLPARRHHGGGHRGAGGRRRRAARGPRTACLPAADTLFSGIEYSPNPVVSLFLQDSDDPHEWWSLDLYAGGGQRLQPGASYPDAQGNADGPGPGVRVSGGPAWCNQTASAFTVHSITYLPDGRLRSFDTSFERRCYPDERAAARGTWRFRAGDDVPLPAWLVPGPRPQIDVPPGPLPDRARSRRPPRPPRRILCPAAAAGTHPGPKGLPAGRGGTHPARHAARGPPARDPARRPHPRLGGQRPHLRARRRGLRARRPGSRPARRRSRPRRARLRPGTAGPCRGRPRRPGAQLRAQAPLNGESTSGGQRGRGSMRLCFCAGARPRQAGVLEKPRGRSDRRVLRRGRVAAKARRAIAERERSDTPRGTTSSCPRGSGPTPACSGVPVVATYGQGVGCPPGQGSDEEAAGGRSSISRTSAAKRARISRSDAFQNAYTGLRSVLTCASRSRPLRLESMTAPSARVTKPSRSIAADTTARPRSRTADRVSSTIPLAVRHPPRLPYV